MQGKTLKQLGLLAAAVGLIDAWSVQASIAAPPGVAAQVSRSPTPSQSLNPPHEFTQRLDLRMPAYPAAQETSPVFPSPTIHRHFDSAQNAADSPALDAASSPARPPLQELARRIQHEGVPIARLWENKSALVHIGLNQKGKPGLWLVQKIH